MPLYPASLFQNETDGEGMSFVLYFRLSDGYSKELPPSFIESIRVSFTDLLYMFSVISVSVTIFSYFLYIIIQVCSSEH